ncbi:MAG: hypothetical protein DPW18_02945 [Chloroflexi bacterium]|nr:hypothetical protein [Chloroflexota bacterium]MDL1942981.1 hypothetical protein [Chloroflexi bacterium CFX2]
MLSLMALLKRVLGLSTILLTVVLLTACGIAAHAPTAAATRAPSLTSIAPSITATNTTSPTKVPTATPEPGIPLGCVILNEEGKLYVLGDDVFFALGPSGEELDQALADDYPEWANYRQDVSWYSEPVTIGKIVREASFQEKFALNSAVTLVTLGESLNWQLPSNSDLFLRSLAISERLHHLWFEWTNPQNEQIRAQFPEVTNAATYTLYVFFEHDTPRLQSWCNTYKQLFGTPP